nr:hypothetical protein [Tanacetum cinerariifolium]
HGFLSQKRSGGGRGVKEKHSLMVDKEKSGVEEKLTTLGNAPGKSSYANVTCNPRGKKVNVCTLFTPRGNRIDVVVLVDSIRAISKRFANTAYGFFLGKKVTYPIVFDYVRNTWEMASDENLLKENVSTVLVWVKLHDVPVMAFNKDGLSTIATKLDNIVVAMPKITKEGHYTCYFYVEYEWKPPRCSSCKVFGHIHKECLTNIGFKPYKEYRHVLKKSTASSSGNKKKGVEPTIKVSNSNPFDVFNLVDNDVEFGTNGGTTNLVNNGATLSGSPSMNFDNSSSGTTPIIEKIKKFEDLLTSGKAILVDKAINPLKKVEFLGKYDSEDEVASVDNDMARSMAYERVGFGTQSLLEQWRDLYGNGDNNDDPYDDDMYEGQDQSHKLQAICDNLDICV